MRTAASLCLVKYAVFLTAGNTVGKISLVQITSPFSGLVDFLYDHLGAVMVGTCFS